MDNQKLQTIETLYQLLFDNSVWNNNDISKKLGVPNDIVMECVNEMEKMGLRISSESNLIKLHNKIDEINPEYIASRIQANNINTKIHYLFTTHSTNQLAKTNKSNAIYLCNHQSQGKGRQEKKWITPLGQSIAMSISHNFSCGLQKLSGLNIAIGVAIIKTMGYFGQDKMGLKWPNDVIDERGKVAGILIEITGNLQQSRAIIGIGINWNIPQELFRQINQPCANADINKVSRNQFIVELIKNIYLLLEEFEINQLENIRSIWHENDVYLNKSIRMIQGNTSQMAIYKGIDKDGLLSVKINNQVKSIASGEVSIRSANESTST